MCIDHVKSCRLVVVRLCQRKQKNLGFKKGWQIEKLYLSDGYPVYV